MAIRIGGLRAAGLQAGHQTKEAITNTLANTDYEGAAVPGWARYINVFCASAFIVAYGEATSSTNGCYVQANVDRTFPIPQGKALTVHTQSASAGAVVHVTYLTDVPG